MRMQLKETFQSGGLTIDKGRIVQTRPCDDDNTFCQMEGWGMVWVAVPNELLQELPIGYMQGTLFVCPECTREGKHIPVYEINIKPYSQSCHRCGKILVKGVNVELFARGDSVCVVKDDNNNPQFAGTFSQCMDWLYMRSLNYHPTKVKWDCSDDDTIVATFGDMRFWLWKS